MPKVKKNRKKKKKNPEATENDSILQKQFAAGLAFYFIKWLLFPGC